MHPSSEAVHGWDGVFGEFLYFPLNFVLNLKLLKKKKKKTRGLHLFQLEGLLVAGAV